MTRAATEAEAAILSLLASRGAGLTICPSEAARVLDAIQWRNAMPAIHATARELSSRGIIVLTQGGIVRSPADLVGAYRIRRP